VDETESPEWESANERTVKWDKEQTRYLRERLRSRGGADVEKKEIEHQLNITHWAGRAAGLESAARLARQRAAEHFCDGRSDDARHWGRVSEWLAGLAKVERVKQRQLIDAEE
jgi:hypothetical protein